ncbi:MAG TPA: PEP-CTERM sorting domain-containing protein [Gemmataceae bacterium]
MTIGPFVNPPPTFVNGSLATGSISASIAVQPAAVQSAPEPSSLMLACLGLPSLGLARWFRHRRKDLNSNASKA